MQLWKKKRIHEELNPGLLKTGHLTDRVQLFRESLLTNIRHNLKSFRVWIFLLVVIVAWIPCLALTDYILMDMENIQMRGQIEEMQHQCTALSRQMSRSAYLSAEKENSSISMNAELNQLADLYDGRIMVINSNFQTIVDTYNTDTDKYNISSNVMACFQGKEPMAYMFHRLARYAEFTIPIYDQALQEVKGVMVCSTSTRLLGDRFNQRRQSYDILKVAVCILVAVIAFFASRILMNPLRRLKSELNRANQGDMEPISVEDCTETHNICAVYNESLLRLKHLDESRQEFVSNVSHELKTPITSMRILADSLLSMGDAPAELYQEFMADISHEIERESAIIDDLLEMVRLDRSNAVLQVDQVNMNELLERVLKRLRGAAELRQVKVTLECIRSVDADVDELKFSRVVTNLVENAIKYNREGGSVSVSLNADQTYFYVKIVDTGVGIPEDEVGKIFERFYRVDKARSRETGGTGLGLSICKNIIQLHHGVIRVSSDYGVGSTFVVRVPLVYIP